jgi:hypothetical protein
MDSERVRPNMRDRQVPDALSQEGEKHGEDHLLR